MNRQVLIAELWVTQPLEIIIQYTKTSQFYPVQITARNDTIHFDYPPWDTTYDYKWDPHVIMTQSKAFADKNQQGWDLKGDNIYPQIGANILDHNAALSFLDLSRHRLH